MTRRTVINALVFLSTLALAGGARASDRADWGIVLAASAPDGDATLLVENDRGVMLLAVDLLGDLRGPARARVQLQNIRPGDRVDFAVSTWGGTNVVDVLRVTPRRPVTARP